MIYNYYKVTSMSDYKYWSKKGQSLKISQLHSNLMKYDSGNDNFMTMQQSIHRVFLN